MRIEVGISILPTIEIKLATHMQTVATQMVKASATSYQAVPDKVALQDAGCWPGLRVEEWESDSRELEETTLLQHAVALSLESRTLSDVKWSGGKARPTRFTPGCSALLPAFAPYSIKAKQLGMWRGILLFVQPDFLQALCRPSSTALELIPGTDIADPFIQGAALALANDVREGYPAGELYGEAIALAVCRHLLRTYTSKRVLDLDAQQLSLARERSVVDYIHAHLGSRLSLAKLAAVAGCNESTVYRFFRKKLGTSPHQFLMRCRLEHAKSLLRATDLDIATIALDCGFSSQSHFSEAFRRSTGVSPSRYRSIK